MVLPTLVLPAHLPPGLLIAVHNLLNRQLLQPLRSPPHRALHCSPDGNKLLTGTKRRPALVWTLVLETDEDTNPGLPAQEIFYYLPSLQPKHSSLYYCLTLLPALGYTCEFRVTCLCPIELFIS